MDSIKKVSRVDKALLSGEQYFQSLLEQAWHIHLISDAELEKIQTDCLGLLAKLTEKYNRGFSSSIRLETSQKMLTSIMFTISLFLKTFENPDDAVNILCSEKIEALYDNGLQEIHRLINKSKLMHARLNRDLFETPNIFYRSTIVDGINGFFKLYQPEFFAQELHITADYPTFFPVSNLTGIEFIKQYLEKLYTENDFLKCFSADSVHHILCSYDAAYQELLFNIYEVVLTTALGCVLMNADCRRLTLNSADSEHLLQLFQNMPKDETLRLLLSACDNLGKILSLSDCTQRYVRASVQKIAVSVKQAADMDTLNQVFLMPSYPENNPSVLFSFGDKMTDEHYRQIIEEIMQCRTAKAKIEIIRQNVQSLADLEDILLDAELTEKEIAIVLSDLHLTEIAALTKKYPVFQNVGTQDLKENETLLSSALKNFIATLPPQKQLWIKKGADTLEIKD